MTVERLIVGMGERRLVGNTCGGQLGSHGSKEILLSYA